MDRSFGGRDTSGHDRVHHPGTGRGDRAGVRFHQRLPRHRKCDGDVDRHRSAETEGRGGPVRSAQPRRRIPVDPGRQDGGESGPHPGQERCSSPVLQRSRGSPPASHDRVRGPGGRHHLESGHLVVGPTVQFLARIVRWPDRGGGCRARFHQGRGLDPGPVLHRHSGGALADRRAHHRGSGYLLRLLDHLACRREVAGEGIPLGPDRLRVPGVPGSWHR